MQNMPPMSEVRRQPNRFTSALVKGPRVKVKAKPIEPIQAERQQNIGIGLGICHSHFREESVHWGDALLSVLRV